MKKQLLMSALAWFAFATTNAQWSLTGNTISSGNFLGTTNNQNLVFKANGQLSGLIDVSGSTANTFWGYKSGGTLGSGNAGNVAIGVQALASNTSNANTAIGYQALFVNSTGNFNNAFGSGALHSNTYGTQNCSMGTNALFSNISGSGNTANGFEAEFSSTNGFYNTAIGETALYNCTSGGSNTAIGDDNLIQLTTGQDNTSVGDEGLNQSTVGNGNTSLGADCLDINTTGSNNTGVGYFANVNSNSLTNATVLGYNATATASNEVVIGNTSVTQIIGYAPYMNLSDGRVKKNIKAYVPGLVFINKLQPITYNYDLEAIDNVIQRPPNKDKKGNIIQPSQEEIQARKAKEKIVYSGFIAQDVEKVAKSLNYNFSGVASSQNSRDLYALDYSAFVVPLVKAVQELSSQNDSLKKMNEQLQTQLNQLSAKVNVISAKVGVNLQSITLNATGALEQNLPNPFNSNTVIGYSVPENAMNAKLVVTDISGAVLKEIQLSNKDAGQVIINAGTLSAGNYVYTLFVDNQKIESKQMVLTK